MTTVCWLFMADPLLEPLTYGRFNGHTHDAALASDGEGAGLFVVPCSVCHVANAVHGLAYEMAIQPVSEAGVLDIPLGSTPPPVAIN